MYISQGFSFFFFYFLLEHSIVDLQCCVSFRCTAKVTQLLKILQVRFQQYVNHELPDVQAGFRKGRGIRDQIANHQWIIKKSREFQKNIYFCFIYNAKAFDRVYHNKLWKIMKEMGITDHLTCL